MRRLSFAVFIIKTVIFKHFQTSHILNFEFTAEQDIPVRRH